MARYKGVSLLVVLVICPNDTNRLSAVKLCSGPTAA